MILCKSLRPYPSLKPWKMGVYVSAKSKSTCLISSSKETSLASKVGHGSSKTYELHISSDNDNGQTSNIETLFDEISLMYASPNCVRWLNASSSPTNCHWNRPKRKTQDLDDACRAIDILDTIVIDDTDFVDEYFNSTSLFELLKQETPSPYLFIFNLIVFLLLMIFFIFSWTFKNYMVTTLTMAGYKFYSRSWWSLCGCKRLSFFS